SVHFHFTRSRSSGVRSLKAMLAFLGARGCLHPGRGPTKQPPTESQVWQSGQTTVVPPPQTPAGQGPPPVQASPAVDGGAARRRRVGRAGGARTGAGLGGVARVGRRAAHRSAVAGRVDAGADAVAHVERADTPVRGARRARRIDAIVGGLVAEIVALRAPG